MSFWHGDHHVCWHGMAAPASPALKACNSTDLLDAIIAEFAAFFTEPTGMPPPRARDHGITLLPGSAPVAVRPYHYPATNSVPPCSPRALSAAAPRCSRHLSY